MIASSPFLSIGRCLRLVVVLLLAMLIAGVLASPTIHAAEGKAQFTIAPGVYDPSNSVTRAYFVLNLSPGTTTNLSVRVTNIGTATGSVSLYPTDATTGQTSGTVYRGHSDPRTDVGAWMNLNTPQLTLNPSQSELIPFQLTIPRDVRPGQHAGGIVAEQVNTQTTAAKNGQFHLNIYYLTVVPVQVNLPGPAIEQLTATGIQAGGANNYQVLQVKLHNTGTMMVKGNGSLQVRDAQGVLLQNLPINLNTFLPATSIDYPVNVQKKALGPGDYQATLDLTYGHSHVLHYVTKFTITQAQVNQAFSNSPLQAPTSNMPLWQIILVALAALIVLLLGGQKLYGLISARRRKQTKNPTPPVDGSHSSMDTSKRRDKVA